MSEEFGIDVVLEITEGTTPVYTVTLLDKRENPDGEPIPGSVLDSLTLTYYQEYSQAIINGRNAQNVNGANGVAVDEDGVLTWQMALEDTVILNDALEAEPHIALITFAYPPDQVSRHRVRFLVTNVQRDGA